MAQGRATKQKSDGFHTISLHLHFSIFPLSFHLFSYSAICHSHFIPFSFLTFLTFSFSLLFICSFIYNHSFLLFLFLKNSLHNISKFILEIQYMSENTHPLTLRKQNDLIGGNITKQNFNRNAHVACISHAQCIQIHYFC